MKAHFITKQITYDGSQINSLWTFRQAGLAGDSIVAFIGPCQILPEHMVDLEDLKAGAEISSPLMLHFIIEQFDPDLTKAILSQRLLTVIIKDCLEAKIGKRIRRKGSDLYDANAKLTISIATVTPVSSKIHFGINIISRGTPVLTKGLRDYRIEPKRFALEVMKRYIEEITDITRDRCKVRGVK
jgi:hypothetical protein